jgi:geranylgeranyl diphosphate synthase type II
MKIEERIELGLQRALSDDLLGGTPPRLAEAVRYAVFPGGARVRPRLCLAIAEACSSDDPVLAQATATAVELLHCASLVHDDLPCFDGSHLRRGKPSVHVAYGRALALLAGDALIVHAYHSLSLAPLAYPERLAAVVGVVSSGVGMPGGIVAGQAWECEHETPLQAYQRAKTGGLFRAATMGGAAAAGFDPQPWRRLGDLIGEAYQVADDLLDANGDPEIMGKPAGRDAALGRPSSVGEKGQRESTLSLRSLVEDAVGAIPPCPGERALRHLIAAEAEHFVRLALDCRAAA